MFPKLIIAYNIIKVKLFTYDILASVFDFTVSGVEKPPFKTPAHKTLGERCCVRAASQCKSAWGFTRGHRKSGFVYLL